ncbi:hypothetical protein MMC26_003797 [Xylographa opegraphella]|nr:hypothetical protein [Xylographa opegraphella]
MALHSEHRKVDYRLYYLERSFCLTSAYDALKVLLSATKDAPQASSEVYLEFKSAFRGFAEQILALCWDEDDPTQPCPERTFKFASFLRIWRTEYLSKLDPFHMSDGLLRSYCDIMYDGLLQLHTPCWCGATFNCSAPHELLFRLNKARFNRDTGVTMDCSTQDLSESKFSEPLLNVLLNKPKPEGEPVSIWKQVVSLPRLQCTCLKAFLHWFKNLFEAPVDRL